MDLNLPFQSLHGHSQLSDGLMSHEQILDECAKNKIGVVAVTDHDTLIEPEIFEKIKKLNHRVKFVSGIEVSCDFVPEVQGNLSTFHITGLFVDPTNKELFEFCQMLRDGRRKRLKKYVEKLVNVGFDITEEDVLKEISDGGTIGRPHMATALAKKKKNLELLEKFYQELIVVAKTDQKRASQLEEINSAVGEYKEKKKWFSLVLAPDTIHSAHVEYYETGEKLVSVDDVARVIRLAGGVALVAHWSYLRDKFTFEIVEKLLSEGRIDGMETIYSFGIEDLKRSIFESDQEKLSKLCQKYNLIQGGGIDFHKSEDLALMLNPNFSGFAERTKGLLENILNIRPKIDTSWSTL